MKDEALEKRILELLKQRGPLTMDELVEVLGWQGDKRPLRLLVAEMVRKGLITKKPDYDRRKMLLYPAG